jgi:hypothetical protein
MDVDQCIDVWQVHNRHVSEIESLGLQKLTIATDVGFPVSFFPHLCYC